MKTVGVLVLVSGAVLLLAASRRNFPAEIILLAIGQALALAAVDIFYSATGRIATIYLLDAAAEILLAAMWVAGLPGKRAKEEG